MAYPWPQRPAGIVEEAFAELAKRWRPLLDMARDHGRVFGYELHPGSDLFDGATFERFLEVTDDHPAACVNYDPSHLLLQQLDYLRFIEIYGARISLVVVAVTLGVGGVVGVSAGLVAGFYSGWVDEVVMRVVDIKLAIPTILLALVLVLALGQSFLVIVAILAIAIWPRFARNVRGEVLQLKTMDYVALAKVSGASTPRILLLHIFPGVIDAKTCEIM